MILVWCRTKTFPLEKVDPYESEKMFRRTVQPIREHSSGFFPAGFYSSFHAISWKKVRENSQFSS
jgi:hypothetical protein